MYPEVPRKGESGTLYPTVPPKGASPTYLPDGQMNGDTGRASDSDSGYYEPYTSGPDEYADPVVIYPDEASGDYASDDEDEDPLPRSARHKNMRFFANEDEWLNAINENEMDLIYRA